MGKGKARHNPDKPQNNYGKYCQAYDGYTCHGGDCNDIRECKGNRHNCVKAFYHRAASRSNTQINNGDFKRRINNEENIS